MRGHEARPRGWGQGRSPQSSGGDAAPNSHARRGAPHCPAGGEGRAGRREGAEPGHRRRHSQDAAKLGWERFTPLIPCPLSCLVGTSASPRICTSMCRGSSTYLRTHHRSTSHPGRSTSHHIAAHRIQGAARRTARGRQTMCHKLTTLQGCTGRVRRARVHPRTCLSMKHEPSPNAARACGREKRATYEEGRHYGGTDKETSTS